MVDLGAAPGGFSMVAANNIALDSDINRWHSASKGDINREPKKTKRTLGGIQIPRKYGQVSRRCTNIHTSEAKKNRERHESGQN